MESTNKQRYSYKAGPFTYTSEVDEDSLSSEEKRVIHKLFGAFFEKKQAHRLRLSKKSVFASLITGFSLFAFVGWFYWFQWQPLKQSQETLRTSKNVLQIRRNCEEKVWNRPNELNYEWAEGKEWMPLPGEGVYDAEYGWIYPDQHERLKTKTKELSFDECLKKEVFNSIE